jgi:hypothetical protein
MKISNYSFVFYLDMKLSQEDPEQQAQIKRIVSEFGKKLELTYCPIEKDLYQVETTKWRMGEFFKALCSYMKRLDIMSYSLPNNSYGDCACGWVQKSKYSHQ